MRLLIDAGNTRTKWAWAESGLSAVSSIENADWLKHGLQHHYHHGQHHDNAAFATAVANATEIWVSNVAGEHWQAAFEALSTAASITWVSASEHALGVHNGYQTPTQLGSDRWCSLLAAWRLYQHDALVVNAGTALTIDVLQVTSDDSTNKRAQFSGGSIQPGLHLMWQSLQQHASRLSAVVQRPVVVENAYPRNTQQAMLQGCMHAMAGAVVLQYQTLHRQCPEPPLLLLSGGDAQYLQSYLSQTLSVQAIFVDNLVLRGLAYLAGSITR